MGTHRSPAKRADGDIGPYSWKRTEIFVGAAPCGRPRAHNVRHYGNTQHVGRDDPARPAFPLGGRWHLRSK